MASTLVMAGCWETGTDEEMGTAGSTYAGLGFAAPTGSGYTNCLHVQDAGVAAFGTMSWPTGAVTRYFYRFLVRWEALSYLNAKFFTIGKNSTVNDFELRRSTAGVITAHDDGGTQIGSGSFTTSADTWYRIHVYHDRQTTGSGALQVAIEVYDDTAPIDTAATLFVDEAALDVSGGSSPVFMFFWAIAAGGENRSMYVDNYMIEAEVDATDMATTSHRGRWFFNGPYAADHTGTARDVGNTDPTGTDWDDLVPVNATGSLTLQGVGGFPPESTGKYCDRAASSHSGPVSGTYDGGDGQIGATFVMGDNGATTWTLLTGHTGSAPIASGSADSSDKVGVRGNGHAKIPSASDDFAIALQATGATAAVIDAAYNYLPVFRDSGAIPTAGGVQLVNAATLPRVKVGGVLA